jgi:hypothetical protein
VEIMSYIKLNDEELVREFQKARKNFVFAIEGSKQEKELEKVYDELFREICNRNIDLKNFKN